MAWWLFQNVVVTAILALVVALVCRTTRVGPVARHALWLVVLVKFVTPPIVVWPWGVPDPFRVSTLELRLDVRPDAVSPARASEPAAGPASATPPADEPAIGAGRPIPPPQPRVSGHPLAAAWSWLLAVWIAGSAGLLALEGIRLARLSRRVRASALAPPALERRIAELSSRLGLRPIEARVVPGSAPPAVWSCGRTQLLWPAGLPAGLSDACLDGLLLHELAHVRRRDHLVGWLELAAGIVWWWNPLFWFVRSALREQAELACDAWVIAALPDGRRAYAESLLTLSGAGAPGIPSMALVGVRATSRRVLERRLVMIMQGRVPVRLSRIGLLSLALVVAATLPGWATGPQSAPPPPPPPPATPPATVPVIGAPRGAVPVVTPAPMPPRPVVGVPNRQSQAPPVPRQVPAGRRLNLQVPVRAPAAPQPTPQVGNGQIHGRVQDLSDAAVPGVTITLQSPALIRSMVDVTEASGRYEFPIVPIGTYTVTFERSGFKKVVRPNVVIETGFQAEVNARLEPLAAGAELPADGKQLVDGFESARAEIQREADRQIEARRQALVSALEALQDQYTKAGRLDEAVAIRDYLRAGLPGRSRINYGVRIEGTGGPAGHQD